MALIPPMDTVRYSFSSIRMNWAWGWVFSTSFFASSSDAARIKLVATGLPLIPILRYVTEYVFFASGSLSDTFSIGSLGSEGIATSSAAKAKS